MTILIAIISFAIGIIVGAIGAVAWFAWGLFAATTLPFALPPASKQS